MADDDTLPLDDDSVEEDIQRKRKMDEMNEIEEKASDLPKKPSLPEQPAPAAGAAKENWWSPAFVSGGSPTADLGLELLQGFYKMVEAAFQTKGDLILGPVWNALRNKLTSDKNKEVDPELNGLLNEVAKSKKELGELKDQQKEELKNFEAYKKSPGVDPKDIADQEKMLKERHEQQLNEKKAEIKELNKLVANHPVLKKEYDKREKELLEAREKKLSELNKEHRIEKHALLMKLSKDKVDPKEQKKQISDLEEKQQEKLADVKKKYEGDIEKLRIERANVLQQKSAQTRTQQELNSRNVRSQQEVRRDVELEQEEARKDKEGDLAAVKSEDENQEQQSLLHAAGLSNLEPMPPFGVETRQEQKETIGHNMQALIAELSSSEKVSEKEAPTPKPEFGKTQEQEQEQEQGPQFNP